ncbi:MAG TPA: hypothetical protein VFO35_11245 [Steroidobacteraceae bacterium]|nr:hypothetical protein [Steroidobacteraceae bacterium]
MGNAHLELSEALSSLATANHSLNRFDISMDQYTEAGRAARNSSARWWKSAPRTAS